MNLGRRQFSSLHDASTVRTPNRCARAARQQGFTLIELIVVIVIIGIVATFASLSIGSFGDARLSDEAKRLQHLIRLASDEAITQAREYAIQINQQGYSFQVLGKEGKFVPIKDDPLFRAREFDPDIRVKLELNGEAVSFGGDQPPAQIYLLSSGEIAPNFRLLLSDADGVLGQYQIAVAEDGRTALTTLGTATGS